MLGLVSKLLSGTDSPGKPTQEKATDSKEEKENNMKRSTDEAPEDEEEAVQSESKDPKPVADQKSLKTEEGSAAGEADDGQNDEKETDDGSKTDNEEKDDADADDEDEGDAANRDTKEGDEDNRKRSLQEPDSPNTSCSSEEESSKPAGEDGEGPKPSRDSAVVKRRSAQAKKRLKQEGEGGQEATKDSKGIEGAAKASSSSSKTKGSSGGKKRPKRKRKPESTGDEESLSGSRNEELPEMPKRLKQGVDSSEDATPAKSSPTGSDVDDSSEETETSLDTPPTDTTAETAAAAQQTPNKTKNLLVDFVHSPAPQISSLVEITRGHDPITSALPSSSLHSSQEDLSATPPASEGLAKNAKVIDDYGKLQEDQAKTLKRAKDMLKAAFSEEDTDSSGDEAVNVSGGLPDSDADMPAPPSAAASSS